MHRILVGLLAVDEWLAKHERWKREREETHRQIIGRAQQTETFYKIATPAQKRKLAETDTEEKWWSLVTLYRTFFIENPWYDGRELKYFGGVTQP
ncbi:MAG: hypothetical protein A2583_01055 [Bdellovibrionales bacterium RIFOXYD1_FULL_53_11]|nr:MAG: hypothetical protein A2583_01055 [Bdellovibrionales bacterium RIFOXYD1_FULL_53_11]